MACGMFSGQAADFVRHPEPASHARTPENGTSGTIHVPEPRDSSAQHLLSDPPAILKTRSPRQFCRHDTGSSVGNPKRRVWDSNPRGRVNALPAFIKTRQ
jgi:hypothetical protein